MRVLEFEPRSQNHTNAEYPLDFAKQCVCMQQSECLIAYYNFSLAVKAILASSLSLRSIVWPV
uniref:Uncharacterized protein n=1 Tax=Anguilla anguilla TaxID=7936 RepID=A0A0E9SWG5_ANGAN